LKPLFLILFFVILQNTAFWATVHNSDNYKVELTLYTSHGKFIRDTVINISSNPKLDEWTYVILNNTLRIDIKSCNCAFRIFQKEKLISEVYDPIGEETREIITYQYNNKGQLEQKTYKIMNLPWMTTYYEYDENGQLKKEFSSNDRYGEYSLQYIYDNERLLYKIQMFEGRTDTIKVIE
jgi:hypothetical protein